MRPIINLHEFGQLPAPTQALELLAAPSVSVQTLRALRMDLADWNYDRQYRWRLNPAEIATTELYNALNRARTAMPDTGAEADTVDEARLTGHDLDALVAAIDSYRQREPSYYQALVLLYSVQILEQLALGLFQESPHLVERVLDMYDRVLRQYMNQLSARSGVLASPDQSLRDPLFVRTCLELRDNLPNLQDHFAVLVFPPAENPAGRELRHLIRQLRDRMQFPSETVRGIFKEDIQRLTAAFPDLDRSHLQGIMPSSRLRRFPLEVPEFLGILETSLDARTVQTAAETVVGLCQSTDPLLWDYRYLVFGPADDSNVCDEVAIECEEMNAFVNERSFSGLDALLNRISEQEPLAAFRATVRGSRPDPREPNSQALGGLQSLLAELEPTSSTLLLKALLDLWLPAYFIGVASLTHDHAYGVFSPKNPDLRDLVACLRNFRLDDVRQIDDAIVFAGTSTPPKIHHLLNLGWGLDIGERQRKRTLSIREELARRFSRDIAARQNYLAQSPLQRLAKSIVRKVRRFPPQVRHDLLPKVWNPAQWAEAWLESYYIQTGLITNLDLADAITVQSTPAVIQRIPRPEHVRMFLPEFEYTDKFFPDYERFWQELGEKGRSEASDLIEKVADTYFASTESSARNAIVNFDKIYPCEKQVGEGEEAALGSVLENKFDRLVSYLIARRIILALSHPKIENEHLALKLGYLAREDGDFSAGKKAFGTHRRRCGLSMEDCQRPYGRESSVHRVAGEAQWLTKYREPDR